MKKISLSPVCLSSEPSLLPANVYFCLFDRRRREKFFQSAAARVRVCVLHRQRYLVIQPGRPKARRFIGSWRSLLAREIAQKNTQQNASCRAGQPGNSSCDFKRWIFRSEEMPAVIPALREDVFPSGIFFTLKVSSSVEVSFMSNGRRPAAQSICSNRSPFLIFSVQ